MNLKEVLKQLIIDNKGSCPSHIHMKLKYQDILKEIDKALDHDFDPKSQSEKTYNYLYPEETICSRGQHKSYQSFKNGFACCGRHCPCAEEKKDQTMMDIYGDTHPSRVPSLIEKKQQTWFRKYGTTILSEINVEQKKETCLEKYGVTTPLKSPEIRKKAKTTLKNNFNVEYPFEIKYVKERIDKANRRKKPFIRERLMEKNPQWYDKELMIELLSKHSRQGVANILKCSVELVDKRIGEWNLTEFRGKTSYYETAIISFLEEHNIQYEINNRKIIKPKEVDFYLPEHNIGIEFNGLHWHSEGLGQRDKTYHLFKTTECAKAGVELLHIFQDEWDNTCDSVKSIILSKIGKIPNMIESSDCVLKKLTNDEIDDFLELYHLQGIHRETKLHYGLYFNEELISVMSFRIINKITGTYELSRYCTKPYITINNGAKRLLQEFEKDTKNTCNTLVAYSDNRYFHGNLYNELGFYNTKINPPTYWYFIKANQRFDKSEFTKKKLILLGYDKNMTEWDIMQSLNYDRIWDCGNKKWTKTY